MSNIYISHNFPTSVVIKLNVILMIERLKYILDDCEHNPNPIFKKIFLKVAQLPENAQGMTLDFMLKMVEK